MRPFLSMLFLWSVVSLGSVRTDPPAGAERGLADLRPSCPECYFLAAEDLVADPSTTPMGREAAALTVLLAWDTDPGLAASALILLAASAESSAERTGLNALAIEVDPSRADELYWLASDHSDFARRDAVAAELLGSLRAGNPDARTGLRASPDHRARIVAEGVRLGHDPARVHAVLNRWETNIEQDPCRGRITVRVRESGEYREQPCPRPDHHHGTILDDEWRMMVGIELSLLRTAPPSWAAQAAVGLDAPLESWNRAHLERRFGVSADRPLRRNGRWIGD